MDPTGNAAGSPGASAAVAAGAMRSILIFQLGARTFALDIQDVKQIIPMMKLTPLPKTGPVFEGMANIHGQFVPVIQTRECLGFEPLQHDLYTPIILTQIGDQAMGLIVDQVSGVASLRTDQIVHPEKIVPDGVNLPDILRGVVHLSGQMVLLIDPALLVEDSQIQMLFEAIRALGLSEAPDDEKLSSRAESETPADGSEKKKARREQNGLREPLAQELADLAETCPPAGLPLDPDSTENIGEE